MESEALTKLKRHWKVFLIALAPVLFILAIVAANIGRVEGIWLILPLGTARVTTWITIILCSQRFSTFKSELT